MPAPLPGSPSAHPVGQACHLAGTVSALRYNFNKFPTRIPTATLLSLSRPWLPGEPGERGRPGPSPRPGLPRPSSEVFLLPRARQPLPEPGPRTTTPEDSIRRTPLWGERGGGPGQRGAERGSCRRAPQPRAPSHRAGCSVGVGVGVGVGLQWRPRDYGLVSYPCSAGEPGEAGPRNHFLNFQYRTAPGDVWGLCPHCLGNHQPPVRGGRGAWPADLPSWAGGRDLPTWTPDPRTRV